MKIRRCVPCDGNEIRESSGIATGETLERDRDVNILWYEEGEGGEGSLIEDLLSYHGMLSVPERSGISGYSMLRGIEKPL